MPARPFPDLAHYDLILVGGGLANALIAWRLASRPNLKVCLIEQGNRLGGNHTWSFHTADIGTTALADLTPFLIASWPRQQVRFNAHARTLDAGYHSISSGRLHEVLAPLLGGRLRLDARIETLEPNRVVLADQTVLTARCVIDGRGPDPDLPLALGFQKFMGIEVETDGPHGETIPVIMDATVSQVDGYRFVYSLPFTPSRLLIEDTYYSDGATLDETALRSRILAYAQAKGWRIARIVREETGVLPIVLAGDIAAVSQHGVPGVPRSGLRAALFHPTTGYSLPDALALAAEIAALPELTSVTVRACIEARSRTLWAERSFFRLINRMMFIAAKPAERVLILERFYRLPAPVIARFYAAKLTLADKAQIIAVMAVNPPVPLGKALSVFAPSTAWTFAARSKPGTP